MPTSSAPGFTIGDPSNDHLRIRVLGRLYPTSTDFSDGNWLSATIEVASGSFKGRVEASLRAEELQAFRQSLERLIASSRGKAELFSTEEWLELLVEPIEAERLEIRGTVVDQPGLGNKLFFIIEPVEKEDLTSVILGLQDVESSFPVIGRPD